MPRCANCKQDVSKSSDRGAYWTCACGAKNTTAKSRFCRMCNANTYSYATAGKSALDPTPWWLCAKHDRPTYASEAAAKRSDLGARIMGWLILAILALCGLGYLVSRVVP